MAGSFLNLRLSHFLFAPAHHLYSLFARAQPPPRPARPQSTRVPNRTEKASMKAMIPRRRGAGGGLRIKKKARGFMCGCGGSKTVSISDGSDKQSPLATPPTNVSYNTTTMSSTTTTTTTATRRAGSKTASSAAEAPSSFSPSSYYADTEDADTSVAALLRQLGELERTVHSLQGSVVEGGSGGAKDRGGRRHRRTVSEGGGGGARRVEESVAVVKESTDPLSDFRQSMLQMIVEKEIVGGAELRDLLHRFLSLNSPRHHHLILRAFAEIWEEVFAGYERTPDFLASHRKKKLPYGHGESSISPPPLTSGTPEKSYSVRGA